MNLEQAGRFIARTALSGLMLGASAEAGCVTSQVIPEFKPLTSSQKPPEPPAVDVAETPKVDKFEQGNLSVTTATYPSGGLEIHQFLDSKDKT